MEVWEWEVWGAANKAANCAVGVGNISLANALPVAVLAQLWSKIPHEPAIVAMEVASYLLTYVLSVEGAAGCSECSLMLTIHSRSNKIVCSVMAKAESFLIAVLAAAEEALCL